MIQAGTYTVLFVAGAAIAITFGSGLAGALSVYSIVRAFQYATGRS